MSLGAAGANALQMRSAMAIVTSDVLALVPILHTTGNATLQFASSLTSLVGVMTVPTIAAAGTAFASVAIAIKGMGDAVGASDAKGLQDALNQLTPSAQTAALSIRDLRDQFDFSGIQEAFFEPLGRLGQASTLIEPLNEVMRALTGNLGLAASGLVEFLTTGTGLTAVTELLNGTKFAASLLAGGVRNFFEGTAVLGAAAPIFSRMMSPFWDWLRHERTTPSQLLKTDRCNALSPKKKPLPFHFVTIYPISEGRLKGSFPVSTMRPDQ